MQVAVWGNKGSYRHLREGTHPVPGPDRVSNQRCLQVYRPADACIEPQQRLVVVSKQGHSDKKALLPCTGHLQSGLCAGCRAWYSTRTCPLSLPRTRQTFPLPTPPGPGVLQRSYIHRNTTRGRGGTGSRCSTIPHIGDMVFPKRVLSHISAS